MKALQRKWSFSAAARSPWRCWWFTAGSTASLTPFSLGTKIKIFILISYQSWALEVRDSLKRHHMIGWIVSAYKRSFPCMEAAYPYAIKNQRKIRNAPSRGLWVPWADSLGHKRAGEATPWSQPIRAQYLDTLDQWEVSTLYIYPFFLSF